eukprot:1064145-Pleurochrysis_carterae.AAC.1
MVLINTHLDEERIKKEIQYLTPQGLQERRMRALKDKESSISSWKIYTKAGIYYNIRDLEERAAKADVRILSTSTLMAIYGVYMPVRGGTAETQVRKTCEAFRTGAEGVNEEVYVIIGDFNAKPATWTCDNTREKANQVDRSQFICRGHELLLAPRNNREHTFKRAVTKTLIDNILIPVVHVNRPQAAAYATEGVRSRDQKMVIANMEWNLGGRKGTRRPTKRYTDSPGQTRWKVYTDRIAHEAPERQKQHAAATMGKTHDGQKHQRMREDETAREAQDMDKELRERENKRPNEEIQVRT